FNGIIKSLAVSPDGTILLVGTADEKVNAINLEKQEVIYSQMTSVNDYASIAIGSDGKVFAIADQKTVAMFSLSDGRKLRSLRGHTGKISDVAISPDGQTLVSVSGDDRTVRIWDLESGELVKTLAENIGPTTHVAFTPDGKMFITGAIGNDRTFKFWDATNLELLKTSPKQPGFINDLKVSSDGKQLVAAVRNYVKNWDLSTSQEIKSIKGPSLDINTIALSPDNRTVATANKEGTIMLFDLVTGRKLRTLRGHQGWVLSVAFSPDGQYLYSGAEDKIVKVWQLQP
ncbi:MAG: WD40 repeat domain-containing protein, partial [Crocosphaera sp.]